MLQDLKVYLDLACKLLLANLIDRPLQLLTSRFQFIIYFLGKVTRNLYFHPLSNYPGPKLLAATSLVNTYLLMQGKRVYKVAELHDRFGPVDLLLPSQLHQKN